MELVSEPQVFLVARSLVEPDGMRAYLESVGGEGWFQRVWWGSAQLPGDMITEFAGRLCYRSWAPGLNPNVTRIREDSTEYLNNIKQQAHGSVMEHANLSFVFKDVSRVFTHELVTHRVGTAKSQESLRFVRLDKVRIWVPPILGQPSFLESAVGEEGDLAHQRLFVEIVEKVEEYQRMGAVRWALDAARSFNLKKRVTSALRRIAPMGLATDVMWTANLRALRHCVEVRTHESAEEEMRLVFHRVGLMAREYAPVVFDDYEVRDGQWLTTNRKV